MAPTETSRSPSIPRPPGRWRIRTGFRLTCALRPTRTWTTTIRNLTDLRALGVLTTRAGGFLAIRGRRLQTARWTEQLGFWSPEDEVGSYHVVYEVSPGTFR